MPTDDIATILAQVREWELDAHNTWCGDCEFLKVCEVDKNEDVKDGLLCALDAKEAAYKRVADYIESNPVQLHRRLDGQ